jgi:hypothetical protein
MLRHAGDSHVSVADRPAAGCGHMGLIAQEKSTRMLAFDVLAALHAGAP